MTEDQMKYLLPKLKWLLVGIAVALTLIMGLWWMGCAMDGKGSPAWWTYIGLLCIPGAIFLPNKDDASRFVVLFRDKP